MDEILDRMGRLESVRDHKDGQVKPCLASCEDQVIAHYVKTRGQTRGQAIVNYMTIVESMPTYGVHYFEVLDKRGSLWWLGLSCRGKLTKLH